MSIIDEVIRKELWKHHFKYYDLFQNNSDRYRNTMIYHVNQIIGKNLIIDTGAGTGNLSLELLKGGHNVVAIDNNDYALEILKDKCEGHNNLIIQKMNVEHMNFYSETFEGASSMFVMPFVEDDQKYSDEVFRILKKGGIFTISSWAPIKDLWSGFLWDDLEKELTKKGILPKHLSEWNYISKTSRENERTIMKKNLTAEKLETMLKNSGFQGIELNKNEPYGIYAFSFRCIK